MLSSFLLQVSVLLLLSSTLLTSSFHVPPPPFLPSTSLSSTSTSDSFSHAKITLKSNTGGYFRARAHSEASKFRSLTGSLTFTDDCHMIVVEGSKKKIEGFIRWCKKGEGMGGLYDGSDVEVEWGEFEGIWDDFYVQEAK
ncbi:hypothetical protein TrVE_jg13951 [Triparma verrucosa]|uniref:Acylphosphatase-like domain-containing protein n=2 Tax=Triparma TaxID=722752 RepID=A0A9W7A4T5_9STRA|nr:hypothetical protein TrST_g11288 [Triparma strigata]GMI15049.1 hypothetical protein TrVE_jg13951 [Triparma verrucosa]